MKIKTPLQWICDLLRRENLVLEVWKTKSGYACLASCGSARPAVTAFYGEGKTLVKAITMAWGILLVEEGVAEEIIKKTEEKK